MSNTSGNLEDEKGSVNRQQDYFENMPELVRWLFLQSAHDKFVHAAQEAQLKTSTIQGWMRENKTPNAEHFERWLIACGKSWKWFGSIKKGSDFYHSAKPILPAATAKAAPRPRKKKKRDQQQSDDSGIEESGKLFAALQPEAVI